MKRALTALLAVALLAGCGSEEAEQIPGPCLAGTGEWSAALASAPEAVTLEGGVPIPECLVPDPPVAQLTELGRTLTEVATTLNAQARAGGQDAALELGYLVGTLEQGGAAYEELARRVESAASLGAAGSALGPAFERRYDEGRSAASASG